MAVSSSCFDLIRGDQPYSFFDSCTIPQLSPTLNSMLFLWALVAFLIAVTLCCLTAFSLRAAAIRYRLWRLRKQIIQLASSRPNFVASDLDPLRKIFSANHGLRLAWEEFEETLLVPTTNDANEPLRNTRQAEEYFTEELLVSSRINLYFYSSLPGIITSFGLLATFIAILIGLSSVHEDPNTKQLQGVTDLVYGLSGKFISSIAALFLAIAFTSFEKSVIHRLHQAYLSLISTLNSKFQRMPAERILNEILRHSKEQAMALLTFNADLSSRLKEGVSEGLGPLTSQLTETLAQLRQEKNESSGALLSTMVQEFRSALMGSAQSELGNLSAALTDMVAGMREMNNANQQIQQRMSDVLGSFDQVIGKQSASSEESLSRLTATMESVVAKLQDTANHSTQSMSSSVGDLLRQVTESSSGQLASLKIFQQDLTAAMTAVVSRIENATTGSSTKMNETVSELIQKVETLIEKSSGSMETSVSNIVEQTSNFSTQTSKKVEELFQLHSDHVQRLDTARQGLLDAVVNFRTAIDSASPGLARIGDATSEVRLVVEELRTSATTLTRLQQSSADFVTNGIQKMEQFTPMLTRQQELLQQFESVYSTLDQSIARALNMVAANLDAYTTKVHSSLETFLNEFDNHLANATSQLGSTVTNLSDTLENLADMSAERTRTVNA